MKNENKFTNIFLIIVLGYKYIYMYKVCAFVEINRKQRLVSPKVGRQTSIGRRNRIFLEQFVDQFVQTIFRTSRINLDDIIRCILFI